MSNKIYREVVYSADENGVSLRVYAGGPEALLDYCGAEVAIGAADIESLSANLEELRDLFQAAIDDLAIPALEEASA